MAGTAYTTVLALLRARLGEATARAWSDATLNTYISYAERWYAGYFGPKPGVKLFRNYQTFNVAANTSTFDLTTLGDNATKPFHRVVKLYIEWQAGRLVPLKTLDDNAEGDARNAVLVATGPIVPRYSLQGEWTLLLLPLSGSQQTFYLRHTYLPIAKTSGNLETPTVDDDLIVLRALHYAQANTREESTAFETEYAARIEETTHRLVGRENDAMGERVRRHSRAYR